MFELSMIINPFSKRITAVTFLLPALLFHHYALGGKSVDLSGSLSLEGSAYFDEGQFARQDYQYSTSIAAQPEFYWSWNKGNDSLTFTPFYRHDSKDDERSHGDLRELIWVHLANQWEFRTGVRKVFWGVTEFVHLIDIINQSDSVDSFDNEEKLGQPMVNISYVADWGILDAFVLTGFRERTFPGESGRLRTQLLVDTDAATFEASDEDQHIDYALRWAHSIGVMDLGFYGFKGTDRNPILQLHIQEGKPILIPYYQQITQYGADIQATVDSWLLKFEGLHQRNSVEDFYAAQFGFEYTFYGLAGGTKDLGILLEYGWDERGEDAHSLSQNDAYSGARLTFNDTADTTLLMGLQYDFDFHSRSFLLEASRRLNDRWTAELEVLFIDANHSAGILSNFDEDDRVLMTLERFF